MAGLETPVTQPIETITSTFTLPNTKWGPDLNVQKEEVEQPKNVEEQSRQAMEKLTNFLFSTVKTYFQAKNALDKGVSTVKANVENFGQTMNDKANQKIADVQSGVRAFGEAGEALGNSAISNVRDTATKTLDAVDNVIERIDAKVDDGKKATREFITNVNTEVFRSSTNAELEANMIVQETSASIGKKALNIVQAFGEKLAKPFAKGLDFVAETSAKAVVETVRSTNNAIASIEQTTATTFPMDANSLEKGAQFARRLEHGILSYFNYGMEGKKIPEKVSAYHANKRVESVAQKLDKQGLTWVSGAIRGINKAINATETRGRAMRVQAEEAKANAKVYLDRAKKWGEFKSKIEVTAFSDGVSTFNTAIKSSLDKLETERESRSRRNMETLLENNPGLKAKWENEFAKV